jgi:hypothetical protein
MEHRVFGCVLAYGRLNSHSTCSFLEAHENIGGNTDAGSFRGLIAWPRHREKQ